MRTTITELRTVVQRKAVSEPPTRGSRPIENEPLKLVHVVPKVGQAEQASEQGDESVEMRVKRFIQEQTERGRTATLSEIMNQCQCSKNTVIRCRRELVGDQSA